MKKRVFNLSHNFLFEKNNNNNPYIYIGLWYLSSLEPKQVGEIWIEICNSQRKAEVSYKPNEDIPFNLCQFP